MTSRRAPNLDLNLLQPLNALLIERSVTRAAERLAITQPGMSTALSKLRRHYDDPLLVREGKDWVLTPLAESLRQPVQRAVDGAQGLLSFPGLFDPAEMSTSFNLSASDYVTNVLLTRAFESLTDEAPNARVRWEWPQREPTEMLRSGDSDLMFWPLQLVEPEWLKFPHAAVHEDRFVVVARAGADLPERLTAAELASLPSVQMVGVGGERNLAQARLEEQQIRQNAVVLVHTFTMALQMAAASDLITTTPRRLLTCMRPVLGLREIPVDAELPKLTEAMFWHPRTSLSPGHRWLRARIQQAAAELDLEPND